MGVRHNFFYNNDITTRYTVYKLVLPWGVAIVSNRRSEPIHQDYHGFTVICRNFWAQRNSSLRSRVASQTSDIYIFHEPLLLVILVMVIIFVYPLQSLSFPVSDGCSQTKSSPPIEESVIQRVASRHFLVTSPGPSLVLETSWASKISFGPCGPKMSKDEKMSFSWAWIWRFRDWEHGLLLHGVWCPGAHLFWTHGSDVDPKAFAKHAQYSTT